ncbi:MAG TPA: sigma-54-dependent Fis family transcriptional regulator [bacterium]|nr:sigma-54-dependent Fis family transcriptional regulator [bacterium]
MSTPLGVPSVNPQILQHLKGLKLLKEFTLALENSDDLAKVLADFLQQVIAYMGMERGMLILLDRSRDGAKLQISQQLAEADMEELGKSVLKQVLATGKVFSPGARTFNDATPTGLGSDFSRTAVLSAISSRDLLSPEAAQGIESSSIKKLGLKAVCAVPLKNQDQVFGVLYLDSKTQAQADDPFALGFLDAFAAISGSILHKLQQLETAQFEAGEPMAFGDFLTANGVMKGILKKAKKVARYAQAATILIRGETGTGKDVLAQALHSEGARNRKSFVVVNCPAIPESLFESQLFGSKKGAFTDAHEDKQGLVAAAEGGTLFFDEIGDMPLEVQAKVLRLLENREYIPLGSTKAVNADITILAATNADLPRLVEEKKFREDLYARLDEIVLEIPPLRFRPEDIGLIAHRMVEEFNEETGTSYTLDEATVQKLQGYEWPRNVRELRTVLHRAMLLGDGEHLEVELKGATGSTAAEQRFGELKPFEGTPPPLIEVEEEHILRVLLWCEGNKRKAAQVLGIGEKTLYDRLSRMLKRE